MSEYTIRKLGNDEFHLLLPLMTDCFGMEVNVQYFQWKFVDNPAGFVEGYIAVAQDGEIAAYYGVIPELYSIAGKQTVIYQSCDTMTHSKHRRKGLFQKLALHCYEALRAADKLFVIGFGGGQSTPGFLKFGWKQVFDMRYYFYPRQLAWRNTAYRQEHVRGISDPVELEELISRSNAGSKVHSHKNAAIFRWRTANPKHDYKLIAHSSPDTTDGYACYYTEGDKVILFDFFFESNVAGKALTASLKKVMKQEGCKGILSFTQENSALSAMLRKLGFISNPFSKGPLSTRVPFIFYAGEKQLQEYADARSWTIGSFDHDAL